MAINLGRIFDSLEPMEQDFIEAEASVCGLTIDEMVIELVREGFAAADVMNEVFQTTDRQWKSH